MGQPKIKPEIETPRLTLRAPVIADAPHIAHLANDLDVARMTARLPYPYRRIDAEDFIARTARPAANGDQTLVIDHADEGPIGSIGLFTSQTGHPEIGYWIGKPFWGRGLATEALRGLQTWAHGAKGRRYLTAGHFADNAASAQVLIKAGFLYTGEVRSLHSLARNGTAPSRQMVWLP